MLAIFAQRLTEHGFSSRHNLYSCSQNADGSAYWTQSSANRETKCYPVGFFFYIK